LYYLLGTISRVGCIGGPGGNRKAPDITLVYCSAIGFNVIDPPVVSGARNKTVRKWHAGKANNKKRRDLVATVRLSGAIVHIVKILAEIYIVRDRKISRRPAKACPRILI